MGLRSRPLSPHTVRRVREKSATQPTSAVVDQQCLTTNMQLRCEFHQFPHAAVHPGSVLGPRADEPRRHKCLLKSPTSKLLTDGRSRETNVALMAASGRPGFGSMVTFAGGATGAEPYCEV